MSELTITPREFAAVVGDEEAIADLFKPFIGAKDDLAALVKGAHRYMRSLDSVDRDVKAEAMDRPFITAPAKAAPKKGK